MKVKFAILGLVAAVVLNMTGCSNLYSNSYTPPTAAELKEYENYRNELYSRLSSVMVEPAKKSSKLERQIVNEFFSYRLRNCGYNDYSVYKSSKCNIEEVIKEPYQNNGMIFFLPVLNVEKGFEFYNQINQVIEFQNYVPGKSIDIIKYQSLEVSKYFDQDKYLDMSRFIDYKGVRYFYNYDDHVDFLQLPPDADFNNWRFAGFQYLSPDEKRILGSVNTFNFDKEDCY